VLRDKTKRIQLEVPVIRQQDKMQDLSFSQTYFWKVWCTGLWRHVFGRVVPDFSKTGNSFENSLIKASH